MLSVLFFWYRSPRHGAPDTESALCFASKGRCYAILVYGLFFVQSMNMLWMWWSGLNFAGWVNARAHASGREHLIPRSSHLAGRNNNQVEVLRMFSEASSEASRGSSPCSPRWSAGHAQPAVTLRQQCSAWQGSASPCLLTHRQPHSKPRACARTLQAAPGDGVQSSTKSSPCEAPDKMPLAIATNT